MEFAFFTFLKNEYKDSIQFEDIRSIKKSFLKISFQNDISSKTVYFWQFHESFLIFAKIWDSSQSRYLRWFDHLYIGPYSLFNTTYNQFSKSVMIL